MLALQPNFNSGLEYTMPAAESHWSEKQLEQRVSSQGRAGPQNEPWLQGPPAHQRRSTPSSSETSDLYAPTHPSSSPAPMQQNGPQQAQNQQQPYETSQNNQKKTTPRPVSQGPSVLAQPPPNERRGSSPGLRYAAEELSRELGLSFDPWLPLPNDRKSSQGSLEQQDPSPTSSNFDGGAAGMGHPSSAPLFISPFASSAPPGAPEVNQDGGLAPRPTVDTGLANRRVATLHLGDLDYWMMDEMYISRCVSLMGWDIANPSRGNTNRVPVSIKMIHGSSNSTSGYCFLRFPTQEHAASVMDRYQASQLRTLMPGSERTFKLNWATGMPGAAPQWENEFSIFVGDLSREVTESELVSLFAPLFPSCQSAKVMYDSSTGHSKGYGFVRFSEEADRSRALALGKSGSGAGLTLRGRTLRISEASSPSSATASSFRSRHTSDASSLYSMRTVPSYDSLFMPDERQRAGSIASSFGPPSAGSHQTTFNGIPDPSRMPPSPTVPFTSDPGNTTVFVGGLPAAITEVELHAMFQDFGPISYVKIPNSLGCGFVQFANRSDAEMAIVKMQNFPVNANARIRLAWGRSATDKHLEQVKKLSVALGMPFDNVLKMVESQDRGTVKNITSAVAHQGPSAQAPTPEGQQNFGPRSYDSARFADTHSLSARPSLERFPHRSTMPDPRSRPSVEHIGHRHSFGASAYDVSPQMPNGHLPRQGAMAYAPDPRMQQQQQQHAHSYGSPAFAQSQARMAALSREDLQRQFVSAAQADIPSSLPPQKQRQMHEERLGVSFADLFGDLNLSSEPMSYT